MTRHSDIAACCQFLLAAMWLGVGVSKLLDVEAFREVVRHHGVIPPAFWFVTSLVPWWELSLGIWMAVFGSVMRWGRLPVVVSLVTLIAFSVYLGQVPTSRLNQVGCGCVGRAAPVGAGGDTSWIVRWPAMMLHVPAAGLIGRSKPRKDPGSGLIPSTA